MFARKNNDFLTSQIFYIILNVNGLTELLINISMFSYTALAFIYFCECIANPIIFWLKAKNINLESFSVTGQEKILSALN